MNYYSRILLIVILIIRNTGIGIAGEIKIGLFYGKSIESFVFSAIEGDFELWGNKEQIAVIAKGTVLHIGRSGSILTVQDTSRLFGSFNELTFKGVTPGSVFQVKPVFPSLRAKESEGSLFVTNNNGSIQLINSVELELYIPGTIEAEGGSWASAEYYKAQAVITRTYAVKNFNRHAHEGFNLCDGVHCQSFNGKSRMNKEIYNATVATQKQILVDASGEPVVTAYHSNCGGHTANASIIWTRDLKYLSSVNDPFCDKTANRNWTKGIPLEKWKNYLNQKGLPVKDQRSLGLTVKERRKYFDSMNEKLPLTEIREDWNLKSSYFQIILVGNNAIFYGHGYGHGLGLCQQGAMEMARVGYTYVDILMFYYKGLKLVVNE